MPGIRPLALPENCFLSPEVRDACVRGTARGQRQDILLVRLEGVSYEQAAAIPKMPVGTIRSRLFYRVPTRELE